MPRFSLAYMWWNVLSWDELLLIELNIAHSGSSHKSPVNHSELAMLPGRADVNYFCHQELLRCER